MTGRGFGKAGGEGGGGASSADREVAWAPADAVLYLPLESVKVCMLDRAGAKHSSKPTGFAQTVKNETLDPSKQNGHEEAVESDWFFAHHGPMPKSHDVIA